MKRRRVRLADDWVFHRGELAARPARGTTKAGGCGGITDLTYAEMPEAERREEREALAQIIKVLPGIEQVGGEQPRAEQLEGDWVEVHIPHDWRIEQTPTPEGPLFQAFSPGGTAYYRRRFSPEAWDPDRRVVLEFDGVMRDSTVWCNGFLVGDHASGYASFRYDVTELLRYGEEGDNVLLVRCDTSNAEGWWYEGGGIYRDVWLTTVPSVHIEFDGVFVTTPSVSAEQATVRAVTTIRNHTTETAGLELRTSLLDGADNIGTTSQNVIVDPDSSAEGTTEIIVPDPRMWDIGDPQLYVLVTEVFRDGELLDRVESVFGIRTIEFRGSGGLFVNGRSVRLQGANLHQDFAGVGVALPDRVIAYKLLLMAEMGCNAVRSAHNPSSPALLDAADRIGILVITENRMLSTAPAFRDDLESLVRRGRNHPSVLIWSLENEESIQGSDQGSRILASLIQIVRRLDPTRPITTGAHHQFDHSYFDLLDVVSVHYQSMRRTIGGVQALRPDKPLMAGEEGLFPTVRGQYEDDQEKGLASSFGTAMGLYAFMIDSDRAYDPGATWRWFYDHPEVAGGFVWTGIDYFGEPTPMRWPVTVSSYGAMDICGFPKDHYWLLRSFFRSEPMVHAMPHWTWPSREGDGLRLWVFTNCDEVELFVNGTSRGRRPAVNNIARWDDGVVYEPGTLLVRGWKDGDVAAEQATHTAGPATDLVCTAYGSEIASDGSDVALVSVAVVDAEGRLCPWADDGIEFTVDGPAEIVGVGNGDPTSLEPHTGATRRAFRGRCLAVVRSLPGRAGVITVRASATGLAEGSTSISASDIAPAPGASPRDRVREKQLS